MHFLLSSLSLPGNVSDGQLSQKKPQNPTEILHRRKQNQVQQFNSGHTGFSRSSAFHHVGSIVIGYVLGSILSFGLFPLTATHTFALEMNLMEKCLKNK